MDDARKNEYRIPEENLGRLTVKIAKLARRASKLGCPPIALDLLRTEQIEERALVSRDGGFSHYEPTGRTVPLYVVAISGEAPKLNGWQFVGTLQHVELENETANILRAIPGETLPAQFRTAASTCEHCKLQRRRNDTFVVRNDAGEYKQIGRQCIADFLGHADPAQVAAMAECLCEAAAISEEAENYACGRGKNLYALDYILTLTAACVRVDGWTSRKAAEAYCATGGHKDPTSTSVQRIIAPPLRKDRDEHEWQAAHTATDADKAEAELVKEWAAHIHETENVQADDYLYNLSVIGRQETIEPRSFGLACSIVAAYNRHMEREIKRQRALKEFENSEFQGTVGERRVFELTVLGINTFETDYGPTHLHRMIDAAGNLFIWWASGNQFEIGKTYRLKATVKEHAIYKNTIKQTVLSRCKQEPTEEEAAREKAIKKEIKRRQKPLLDANKMVERAAEQMRRLFESVDSIDFWRVPAMHAATTLENAKYWNFGDLKDIERQVRQDANFSRG